MKLYQHQVEIIDALHSGKNIAIAGSRRVGLTTAVLVFIEERIDSGPFRARIHTKNVRGILNLAVENKHHVPLFPIWKDGITRSTEIEVSNNHDLAYDFELFDDVDLPDHQIQAQWALTNTQGLCHLPTDIHKPFEFMKGINYWSY